MLAGIRVSFELAAIGACPELRTAWLSLADKVVWF